MEHDALERRAAMMATLHRATNRVLAFAWSWVRPLFVAYTVFAAITLLPLVNVAFAPSAMLKALIAAPVGIAVAFGGRHRRVLAVGLSVAMAALLLVLTATTLDQHDPVFETALVAFFFLVAWITLPEILPRNLRLRAPTLTDLSEGGANLRRALAAALAALSSDWWRIPGRRLVRAAIALGALAVLGIVGALVAAVAGGLDVPSALRLAAMILDAGVGALATWLVARRFADPAASVGAAILWIFGSVRLEYGTLQDQMVTPTCLLPLLTLAALSLRNSGTLQGEWLAAALAIVLVPVSLRWPLLAVGTALVIVFAFWSLGQTREARWGFLPLLAIAAFAWKAWPERIVEILSAQAATYDPARAAVACASGCDGGLPWEFVYPSPFGSAYAHLLSGLFAATFHWGNYRIFSIAPGWAALTLAAIGTAALYRQRRIAVLRVWLLAIAASLALALPSHYLGLALPSFSRLIVTVAPGFQFGAQLAIVGGFFLALLGGIGVAALVALPQRVRVAAIFAAGLLVALDAASIPQRGHLATALASMHSSIDSSQARPKVAVYPFVTPAYGPEFDSLVRVAHRYGYDLVNERESGNAALANLSSPQTFEQLKALGTQYVLVSLSDYTRRREILADAHLLLPLDEEANIAWLAPEPSDILRFHVIRSGSEGALLLGM